MRRYFRSLWAKIGLALASIALTLVCLELIFRLLGIAGEYHQPRADILQPGPTGSAERVPFGFIPGVTVVSAYDSDPRGYFGPSNSISHRFNSVGWRDSEHSLDKPPNTYRILGLGDSYLYGQGVKRSDICLSKLQAMVSERTKETRIECINTGMSGFNTANQRELLIQRGLAYSPDLVIVHFVLNDVEPDVFRPGPKIEFYSEYVAIYQEPDVLSAYSNVWSWARQRYLRDVRARDYIRTCIRGFGRESPEWQQCRMALDDIAGVCREQHISLLVVIFPFFVNLDGDYPFQTIHDIVREYCREKKVHVLDLRDHYRRFNGPELWVHATDQHPNEIAHDIAARAICDYLISHADELLMETNRK